MSSRHIVVQVGAKGFRDVWVPYACYPRRYSVIDFRIEEIRVLCFGIGPFSVRLVLISKAFDNDGANRDGCPVRPGAVAD